MDLFVSFVRRRRHVERRAMDLSVFICASPSVPTDRLQAFYDTTALELGEVAFESLDQVGIDLAIGQAIAPVDALIAPHLHDLATLAPHLLDQAGRHCSTIAPTLLHKQ